MFKLKTKIHVAFLAFSFHKGFKESYLNFVTFQEVVNVSPFPCIKRVKLFKPQETDVVFLTVDNRPLCVFDVLVKKSLMRPTNAMLSC